MTLYPKGERALQVCQSLTDRIGPRPLGSATNQAASDYIYQQFLEMGLAPARQLFVCPEWISLGVSLQVNGKPLPAVVNSFSPPCDIEAGLSPIGSLPELERVDLSDQIAVLYGDLTQGTGYSVRSAFYFPEKDQQVFNILEDKRPAAVITVHSKPGGNERLIRDWQFPIPSITVPADIGLELLLGYRCHAHLQIQSNRVGGVQPGPFCNVIARQPCSRKERLILCAHFDTMEDTPGAIDNASGISVVMTLAESIVHQEQGIGLEFLALNGEETGGVGDAAYLERYENTLDDVLAVINLDGIGQRLGVNTIAMLGCSPPFQEQVQSLMRAFPGLIKVDPWFESDHTAYYYQGVPCLALTSVGVGNVCHTSADTSRWLSTEKLGEVVEFVRSVILSLQGQSPAWSREA